MNINIIYYIIISLILFLLIDYHLRKFKIVLPETFANIECTDTDRKVLDNYKKFLLKNQTKLSDFHLNNFILLFEHYPEEDLHVDVKHYDSKDYNPKDPLSLFEKQSSALLKNPNSFNEIIKLGNIT